jgi:hypothetical protein
MTFLPPHLFLSRPVSVFSSSLRPKRGAFFAQVKISLRISWVSAPHVVLHPWLQQELTPVLADIEKQQPSESWPPEEQRPFAAQWRTWLRPHESAETLPPFRIVLIWDNVAGHLTSDLVIWLFHHGVMPLSPPLSGSWLKMAESVQRIMVPRALAGQHPQTAQHVIA